MDSYKITNNGFRSQAIRVRGGHCTIKPNRCVEITPDPALDDYEIERLTVLDLVFERVIPADEADAKLKAEQDAADKKAADEAAAKLQAEQDAADKKAADEAAAKLKAEQDAADKKAADEAAAKLKAEQDAADLAAAEAKAEQEAAGKKADQLDLTGKDKA